VDSAASPKELTDRASIRISIRSSPDR